MNPIDMSLLILVVLLVFITIGLLETVRRQRILLREAADQYHDHMRACDKGYDHE